MPPNPLKTKRPRVIHSPNNYFRIPLRDLATWAVNVYKRDFENGLDSMVDDNITEYMHLNRAELKPEDFQGIIDSLTEDWLKLPWDMLNKTGDYMTVDREGIMTLDATGSSFSGWRTPGTPCTMGDDFCLHLYDFKTYIQRLANDIAKLYPWDKDHVSHHILDIDGDYALEQGVDHFLDLLIHTLELWAILYCGIDPQRTTTLRYYFHNHNEATARKRVAEYQVDLPERPDYKDTEIVVQIELPVKVRLIEGEHDLDRQNRIVERTFRTLEDIGPDELATIIDVLYPDNV